MASRSQYSTYKNADLRHMLNQRNLPLSGNRSELIARLIDYTLHHPFPFLKLPAEIRNKIYMYAAISDNTSRKVMIKVTGKFAEDSPDYVYAGDINNRSITPPGLFQSCSQIYHESQAIFYRYHDFKFHVWQGDKGLLGHLKTMLGTKRHDTRLEQVLRWFDGIGVDMQKEIRSLEFIIPFYGSARLRADDQFIDDLHERLSEDAYVSYTSMRGKHPYYVRVDLWGLEVIPLD